MDKKEIIDGWMGKKEWKDRCMGGKDLNKGI